MSALYQAGEAGGLAGDFALALEQFTSDSGAWRTMGAAVLVSIVRKSPSLASMEISRLRLTQTPLQLKEAQTSYTKSRRELKSEREKP